MNDLKAEIAGLKNLSGHSCRDVLNAVILAYGRSEFDYCVNKIRKQRLDNGTGRPKRIKFPWSKYKRLYERQGGICPWCDTPMILLRGKIEIDHIDPNAEDFNNDSNLQLMDAGCNRNKNAKSIHEQSKATGKGYMDLLGPADAQVDLR